MIQPKYWCKHCKTFVRDTKLEKANHDATPKHQGNLKRFLRDLHKGHEREEREKQRAKDEVNRLNGVVGSSGSNRGGVPWEGRPAIPPPSMAGNQQATPADRKRQLAQLAEMGVAIPEDFRKDMAMAGDWQTTSETPIYENGFMKKEDTEDVKPEGLNVGVRKRKYEGQEEREEAGETVARKGWGSTIRTYPGDEAGEDDLAALLKNTKSVRRESNGPQIVASDGSSLREQTSLHSTTEESRSSLAPSTIKKEASADSDGVTDTMLGQTTVVEAGGGPLKQEENPPDDGVVFKKRKAKPIRQK